MDNTNEVTIERDIQVKGLTAPRLTPAAIDAVIIAETYQFFPGKTLTICVLTLNNGFSVTGESAAASLENFDEGIGRRIARENARQKIWALEGYLLKARLYEGVRPEVNLSVEQAKTRDWIKLCELRAAMIELTDVARVVATDVPMSESVSARLSTALAEADRLVEGC